MLSRTYRAAAGTTTSATIGANGNRERIAHVGGIFDNQARRDKFRGVKDLHDPDSLAKSERVGTAISSNLSQTPGSVLKHNMGGVSRLLQRVAAVSASVRSVAIEGSPSIGRRARPRTLHPHRFNSWAAA